MQSPNVTQKSITSRIVQLGSKNSGVRTIATKSAFTHYHKRILLELAKFIDNPHCHKKALHRLFYCQSTAKPLQRRQRVEIVKVIAAMFCFTDVENLQIGISTEEDMKSVPHRSIIDCYENCWNEPITYTKYFRIVKLLKLAGLLVIDAVFTNDKELIMNSNIIHDKDLPRTFSLGAYKTFTSAFLAMFKHITDKEDVVTSKKQGIAERIRRGLRNEWFTYKPHSDSYFFKKKRNHANLNRGDEPRYPQGLAIT
ncbi:hypothetical protein ACTTZI_004169 [Vibrio vulnificus]